MADNEKITAAAPADKKLDDKAAKKADKPAKEKVSLGARISKFWREYKSEMKKIVWFSRKDTINSTILVLVSIIVCSAVISLLDYGFSSALMAIGKLI